MTRCEFVEAAVSSGALPHASVALSCRVVGLPRASFYAWRARREGRRAPSERARSDGALTERIRAIHAESSGTYGSPRVHAALGTRGVRCGRKRVERLMRRQGLRGAERRAARVRTTVADPAAAPAGDLVERAFSPDAVGGPDRLWVADITYVATGEGWLYAAVVLDCFSRRVVGWAMADHLRAELVTAATGMALQRRCPRHGQLTHHSDHGCQYTSLAFGQQLRDAGVLPSMGSVGDCYDNAVAESFFATLKVELVYRHDWPTRAAARGAIFRYIETWYNLRRLHSTLGYTSPAAFEQAHRAAQPVTSTPAA
jgi:putative transposase